MIDKAKQIIQLAEPRFDLTIAEVKLLQAVVDGKEANFSSNENEFNDPANASHWDENRTLRASLLVWLCTDSIACTFLPHLGLNIVGAKIVETLDLRFASLGFPMVFRRCAFLEPIRLERAKVKYLDLSSSHLASDYIRDDFGKTLNSSLEARGIEVTSDVILSNGFKATGRVSLDGATVGGNLFCIEGEFLNSQGYALRIDQAVISGGIILSNSSVIGGLRLYGSTIGGNIECPGSRIENPTRNAILAQNTIIKGSIFLSNEFYANGCVSLNGATISGGLSCDQGEFSNKNGKALVVEQAEIKGVVLLGKGFSASGEVNLNEVTIGGNLTCDGGKFSNPNGYALSIEQAEVNSVNLSEGFHSFGQVRLLGSLIHGNLDCHGGEFIGNKADNDTTKRYAILAQNIDIKRAAFLNQGCSVTGEVSLNGATIGGDLSCSKGRFTNLEGSAISAQQIFVKGSVLLRNGFQAIGKVDFSYAVIGNSLELQSVIEPEKMSLYFLFAKIGNLADQIDSWPLKENLFLDGMVYDKIYTASPLDSQSRLQWLGLQPSSVFSPQPYEQLARVLKASGHEQAATDVLIRKQDDLRCYGELSMWDYIKSLILSHTIAHGYRSHQVLVFALIFIFVGTVMFSSGSPTWGTSDLMSPSRVSPFALSLPNNPSTSQQEEISDNYPTFNPLIYSVDAFIPILDFQQQKYWLPNATKEIEISHNSFKLKILGSCLRWYLWVHITFGWVFTSLWVASFTGLVRRIQ